MSTLKKPPQFDKNEDYEKLYGRNIDFRKKTVLDVGAERGSTAYLFLEKGAERVIAVEGNLTFFKELRENALEDSRVHIINVFINSPQILEQLLSIYKPHIIHMDCESCEQFLIQVNPELLRLPEIYQLEVHWKRELLEILLFTFIHLGYRAEIERIYTNSEACDPWNNLHYGYYGDIWMLHLFKQEVDWWKVKEEEKK